MHTVPLPGILFFDAWRIRPHLNPDPKMGEKLPSLGTDELIPEEPANADYGQAERADIQHRREQESVHCLALSKRRQTCSRTL